MGLVMTADGMKIPLTASKGNESFIAAGIFVNIFIIVVSTI